MKILRYLLKLLLSYLPSPLPVGMTAFNSFANDIIELSGKFADEDSLRFAIASMIMHAGESKGYLPKQYFVRRLRKVAANQVAGQVFTDIKEKQKAAQEAAKLAAQNPPEATASNDVQSEQKEA